MAAPPIPSVGFNFPNNNLGATEPSPSNVVAIVGACSGPLAVNTPSEVGGSAQNVVALAGYGPAADLAANIVNGGNTVILTRATSTPGTPSAVTEGSGNTGSSVMTVSGTPFDSYFRILVTCVRSGIVGTDNPGITISFDGGLTSTGEIRIPDDGDVDALAPVCGLTFEFSALAIDEGDTYELNVPVNAVSAANVVTALTALLASDHDYSLIHVCGPYSATDAATIMNGIAPFITAKQFVRVLLETVDRNPTGPETEAAWMAALQADFVTFQSDLACVSAGYAPMFSVVLGAYMWRSIAQLGLVRAVQVAISRDLAAIADGPLTPFANAAPVFKPASLPYGLFIHDESKNPGLNNDQFMTIRSFRGKTGYYITNPNIMSGPTSDYSLLQLGRISDEIARLANVYFTEQLSGDVLLNPATGKVLEKEARGWEQGCDTACGSLVQNQHVSALQTTVGRDANILNFEPIPVTVRWVPKGYPKVFEVTIAVSRSV